MRVLLLSFVFWFLFTISLNVLTSEENHHHHHDDSHDHHEEQTQISDEMAKKSGITTAVAALGNIQKTQTVYGKLTTSPDQLSHIRARFPGQITQVFASIGDQVEAGDKIAEIEFNESLSKYPILSPISGKITQRNINKGDFADEQILFTIAQMSPLWAELKLFPSQAQEVAAGQAVEISFENLNQNSEISHVLASVDEQPYAIARVKINNEHGVWLPGMLVEGKVFFANEEKSIVVDNGALQTVQDRSVVFIKVGETYEARPLELGHKGKNFTEVLSGLNIGDEYVVENSFLIKADIEKSGASHNH